MSSQRTVMLSGILIVALAAYLSRGLFRSKPPQAVAGLNSISRVEVRETPTGIWMVDFDYFFTGTPPATEFCIALTPEPGPAPIFAAPHALETWPGRAKQGSHHMSLEIHYPGTQMKTVRVAVLMRAGVFSPTVIAKQEVNQSIDWPTLETESLDQMMARGSSQDSLKHAAALIDSGDDQAIGGAKSILQKLLELDPKQDQAYVELARVAIKTNWGQEGLHQAEALLASALAIRPDSANAKILLGYVYAHQRLFQKADALFSEVAQGHTDNLWLWSNWGEMLKMEQQTGRAIEMYRRAIAHPMTHDANDRARIFAYGELLTLLYDRKDFDGMESLYKQRIAEFGPGSCYSVEYTRFLLQVRGDAQGAIDLSRRALNQNCNDSPARRLLGLAEYVKWASSTGASRTEALNQARTYTPVSAWTLYWLATSEHTVLADRQLIALGEQVDQKDNEQLDALAYALKERDYDAARRLVALGARTVAPVGEENIPVALLPVLNQDAAGVRAMRRLGVQYSTLRFRGATAFDFAKQQRDEALLSALGKGDTEL